MRSNIAWLGLILSLLAGCATDPGVPISLKASPYAFLQGDGERPEDQRGRFRKILCAVNEARGRNFPAYRPCDEILHHFGDELAGSGAPVYLGAARLKLQVALVAGLAADCVAGLITPLEFAFKHLQGQGYRTSQIKVDGLSSSTANGRLIRDTVAAMALDQDDHLLLLGYSKGAPDILEGLVAYPELGARVAAVVTVSGAVGGSPLSNDAPEWMLPLLEYLPGAQCRDGDGKAIESLKPAVRRSFNATHKLPDGVLYYSLATFARRDHISYLLQDGYDDLARIDPRNDGQVVFYDQVIGKGALLGFLQADHWATTLPFSVVYPDASAVLFDHNAFPREILLEAIVRHVEEQLLAADDRLL